MPDRAALPPAIELEELVASHAPALFEGSSDGTLYAFTDDGPPVSVEALAGRYRALERRTSPDGREQWLNWAVRVRTSRSYIGYVQATIGADGVASIAYVIFAAYQGRGHGRQSVAAMLDLLRERHRVVQATATVDRRNGRSIALLKSLGFRFHGPDEDGNAIWTARLASQT